jgi:hypothetical protein
MFLNRLRTQAPLRYFPPPTQPRPTTQKKPVMSAVDSNFLLDTEELPLL